MPSIYKQHECQSWPKIKVLDELKKKQTNIHRYQVLYWYKEIPVSHSIASFLNINRQPKISKHWGQLIKWQSKTKIHTHTHPHNGLNEERIFKNERLTVLVTSDTKNT